VALPVVLPGVGRVTLIANHESFINFNHVGPQKLNGEERMRNFAGVNLGLVKRVSLEVGYLNQHGFTPGGRDTSDNAATIELKANF
jgi:hypothetical protein